MASRSGGFSRRRVSNERQLPAVALCPPPFLRRTRLDDRARVDSLVNMQRNRRHLKAKPLGLARPLEGWIDVRIVGVGLFFRFRRFRLRRDQPHRRIVHPRFVVVLVLLDFPLSLGRCCIPVGLPLSASPCPDPSHSPSSIKPPARIPPGHTLRPNVALPKIDSQSIPKPC